MQVPVIRGIIDRRILVNYRVEPATLARLLPAPFAPQLYNGYGMAGVCLIRLTNVRPRFAPRWLGIRSENAAHRIAVQWEQDGQYHTGVYIPRRDTSALLNVLAGSRIFPGTHHRAQFTVTETHPSYRVELKSTDHKTHLLVAGTVAAQLPSTSIFTSVEAASRFFEAGSLGYSATEQEGRYEGLELRSFEWKVEPLAVTDIHSSFFNAAHFPAGSVVFDHALLMRDIAHEWHARSVLCAA